MAKSVGPSAEFLQMPIAFNYRYVEAFSLSVLADSLLDSNKIPTFVSPPPTATFTTIEPPTGNSTNFPTASLETH